MSGTAPVLQTLLRYQARYKFSPGPWRKSRTHASIYKRHSTAPVVNQEQCLYWISWYWAEGRRGTGIISPSSENKYRRTTDFGVMPVLCQYRFQCWHGTDVGYRACTDGQLPAWKKLLIENLGTDHNFKLQNNSCHIWIFQKSGRIYWLIFVNLE